MLVLPERASHDVQRLAALMRDAASASGLNEVKTFRARRGAVAGERWRSPVEFLAPDDAHQLYKLLHRHRTLVACFTTVFVRRDPSRHPAVRKEALDLATYVDHKAEFVLVRGDSSVAPALDRFARWSETTSCQGEDDPRCLPLHVFATDRPWPELREAAGREAFSASYGSGRSRTDDRGRRWERAQRAAYHGREALEIAGCALAAGMHWDVSGGRGTGRLTTAREVWKLKERGFVNVYPDAHVRATRTSRARRVWSSATAY